MSRFGPSECRGDDKLLGSWWIPDESGWGASVLQQWDTLFIDLFVYRTDNKPTWFVAAGVAVKRLGTWRFR